MAYQDSIRNTASMMWQIESWSSTKLIKKVMKKVITMADYYSTCAFPKPGNTKKKKLYNGYKDKAERCCYYCGAPYAERHEIFGASNRQTSIEHGFQVDLCNEHHRLLHDNTTEWAQKENRHWKRKYEAIYLKKMVGEGYTAHQAINSWMMLIGKNYIEELPI